MFLPWRRLCRDILWKLIRNGNYIKGCINCASHTYGNPGTSVRVAFGGRPIWGPGGESHGLRRMFGNLQKCVKNLMS